MKDNAFIDYVVGDERGEAREDATRWMASSLAERPPSS